MNLFKQLIAIARDDIKSANILYEQEQYRTSFFLFQQASEKAGKALGIMLGKIKDEDNMRKYGHAIELMFIKMLQEVADNAAIVNKAIKEKKLAASNDLTQILTSFNDEFGNSLSNDIIKKGQIEHTTLKEIDKALSVINSMKNVDVHNYGFGSYTDFMFFLKEHFALNGADDSHTLSQVFDSEDFNNIMKNEIIPLMTELGTAVVSILVCALAVKGHVSVVRYPFSGKSPIGIYTKKNPCVRRQPELLRLLTTSMETLEKLEYLSA